MAWTIRFSKQADKSLRKIDKSIASRILDELQDISSLEDPRVRGKNLTGNLSGLWRYRVGNYRIVCDIEDDLMIVLVIDIKHRSEVYRRQGRK